MTWHRPPHVMYVTLSPRHSPSVKLQAIKTGGRNSLRMRLKLIVSQFLLTYFAIKCQQLCQVTTTLVQGTRVTETLDTHVINQVMFLKKCHHSRVLAIGMHLERVCIEWD